MTAPVISLELNELCPSLLERWMADGSLPNFKRLHDASAVFLTLADASEPRELEPWIQWYSIHTGLAYDQHQVFHLTEGRQANHEDIWRATMAAGRQAMNFASMNARPFAVPGSLFVADPWCENEDAYPAELNIYNRFIAHNVREYSNAGGGMKRRDYARFLRFMVTHGLSPHTAVRTLAQLAGERAKPESSYKRVAILDTLQFDVFVHYYRRMRPDFASFFVNSVAHLQHGHWRHMDPDAFEARPEAADLARYGDAIRTGYVAMDALVGRFLKLADRAGAIVVFQTALSQQPFDRYEASGGQHFHRLRDVSEFLKRCGIAPLDADPVMTHQYLLRFDSNAARDAARARLQQFVIDDDRPVFDFPERESENALYFGAKIDWAADPETAVRDRASNGALRLGDLLYAMDGTKSGCHHPEGALWIRTGNHSRHREHVSILDIFPTMTDLLGIETRNSERRGHSLIGRLHEQAA